MKKCFSLTNDEKISGNNKRRNEVCKKEQRRVKQATPIII